MFTKIIQIKELEFNSCGSCPRCRSSNVYGFKDCECRDCGFSWSVDPLGF